MSDMINPIPSVMTPWTTHICPRCNEKLYRSGPMATDEYVHEDGTIYCEQTVIPESK